MLNELIFDLRELLDLVRKVENYDATLAAAQNAGKPIVPLLEAQDARRRNGQSIVMLRDKWGI